MQPILSKDSANEWNDKGKSYFSLYFRVQPIITEVPSSYLHLSPFYYLQKLKLKYKEVWRLPHLFFLFLFSRKMTVFLHFFCLKFGGFNFYSYFCPRHLQVFQLVWLTELIAIGSALVSIYGKAFIMRFVSDHSKPGKFQVFVRA